jgi:hypothetical protein
MYVGTVKAISALLLVLGDLYSRLRTESSGSEPITGKDELLCALSRHGETLFYKWTKVSSNLSTNVLK